MSLSNILSTKIIDKNKVYIIQNKHISTDYTQMSPTFNTHFFINLCNLCNLW